ncbi:hypothetical protein DPMN_105332 [Dreissena polymorpha]|uniref:Uncharacterized protein n=1 Tax=Dreissena polymorpha TaxID=45954 RepID=A0A9D4K1S2_DREPO|nr:hypothetical protein DPMN_105332 [Dreissena polymorpha]
MASASSARNRAASTATAVMILPTLLSGDGPPAASGFPPGSGGSTIAKMTQL